MNYQDKRQERLFVDSKDYSKLINSDAIYSNIRAPKMFINQQFSQLDPSHTSPIQTYQERQGFIPQKDTRPFRFDGTTESNSFNKTTEQQRSQIYPHQVTNFVTGNSSQVDGSNNSPQHQMTNQNIRRQPHHSHQHAISQGYNPPEDNQTFRFDRSVDSTNFNKTTEQQNNHMYPNQVSNFIPGNSRQDDGSNISSHHQMIDKEIVHQ